VGVHDVTHQARDVGLLALTRLAFSSCSRRSSGRALSFCTDMTGARFLRVYGSAIRDRPWGAVYGCCDPLFWFHCLSRDHHRGSGLREPSPPLSGWPDAARVGGGTPDKRHRERHRRTAPLHELRALSVRRLVGPGTSHHQPPARRSCVDDAGWRPVRGRRRAVRTYVRREVRRIFEPNSSSGRCGAPHSSQSTTAIEENGAPQALQRRRSSPPHCGQASGRSASNSSNQRRAAPQRTHTATQSPSTLRRSSRSQSAALPTA
jgi:hypothetical protein